MRPLGQNALIALGIGTALSVGLYTLMYTAHIEALLLPQLPGLFASMLIKGGLNRATESDFAWIGIPVNALTYALISLAVLSIFRRKKSS